jgi:hypothetical protein
VGGHGRRRFAGAASARETACIALFADIARFRPDDPDALVHASLACPVCLRSDDVEWEGSLQGYDPSVQCRCPSCSQQWRVYLAPEQALRLGLMPAHAA